MSSRQILQLPLPLVQAAHSDGDLELIEQRQLGSKSNYFLRVADDHERSEKLTRMESSSGSLDRRYLERLAAARAVIASDKELSRFVPAADADCWPHPEQLEELVGLRADLLESDNGTAATELRAAFLLHRQAVETAGTFPLEVKTVEGDKSALWQEKEAGKGMRLRRQPVAPTEVLVAEYAVSTYDVGSILGARPTPAVKATCEQHLGVAWERLNTMYDTLLNDGRPLVLTLQDVIHFTGGIATPKLIQMLGEASAAKRKLRVRGGAFFTRVEFPEQHLMIRRGDTKQRGLAIEEAAEFETAVGLKFEAARARGLCWIVGAGKDMVLPFPKSAEEAANIAAKHHVSPLARGQPSTSNVTKLSNDVWLVTVKCEGAAYIVVHGPRMKGQFPPMVQECEVLRRLVDIDVLMPKREKQKANGASSAGDAAADGQPAEAVSSSLNTHVALSNDQLKEKIIDVLTLHGGSATMSEIKKGEGLSVIPAQKTFTVLVREVADFDKKAGLWQLRT